MSDPNDWFESAADAAWQAIEDHHPDQVFPDMDDDDFHPTSAEWETEPGFLTMACGCSVEVNIGDKVWFIKGPKNGQLLPIAIEPVTIH